MKIKTINNIIYNKMNEWLATIPDEEFRREVKASIIVTGGCIVSLLQQEEVNDFDLYISDTDVCEKLSHYYNNLCDKAWTVKREDDRVINHIPSAGILTPEYDEDGEKQPYRVLCVTDNAITLSDKIQIVTRFTGPPEVIHSNYDFIHATNYWTFIDGLVTNTKALESILTRELRYTGSKYPLCSIIRTRKFVSRKWTVNAGQYLKMAMQLNDLDLTDIDVLKEQLIGVDSAFFNQLINRIEKFKKQTEESGTNDFAIESTYVIELIDEVFDYMKTEEHEE